jgi:hypothetical protein
MRRECRIARGTLCKLLLGVREVIRSNDPTTDPTRIKTLAVTTVLWVGTHMPTRNLETVFSHWIKKLGYMGYLEEWPINRNRLLNQKN